MATSDTETVDHDERRLAELGYKQELKRGWSGFSNFAISFSIISVLAGCFTTFGQAYNNGGPIAISWGWPIISVFILIIAFCMAELVSSYPTAGGIYWWASRLGGPVWGWFTGWFNLIGLIAVVASVDYAAATFLNALFGLWSVDIGINFADGNGILGETFILFALILMLHASLNIFSSPLVALFNSISVGWHLIGVAVIILVLVFVPDQHASADFVFTERINNSGFGDGGMYWFYVLPIGGLLTMYTITGYDASAHVSEETKNASVEAPKGVWRSVAYSAIIGYLVLLAITFAAADPEAGAGGAIPIFTSAMGSGWAELVILISVVGQLFCGMACVTSCSRMMFAFSRDRAVPGHRVLTKLNHHRVPAYAVVASCVLALLITLPALKGYGDEGAIPVAFFAVVSIAVIGLYIAYTIPIYLRWRMGDDFEQGPWTLGAKYKWMCPIAVAWVALCTVVFCLPFTPAAVPGNEDFTWTAVNYAPIMVGALLLIVGIWWAVSAKNTFTGPVRHVAVPGEPVDPAFQ